MLLMEGKLIDVWPTSDIRQDTAELTKDMRVIIEEVFRDQTGFKSI